MLCPGVSTMRLAIHDELERPFEDVHRLLVRMLMLGNADALVQLDPRLRRARGVHDARARTPGKISRTSSRSIVN